MADEPRPRKFVVLKRVLIGLAAIVVVLIIVVAMQPPEYQVVRSAVVAAPPSEVFARVNDFHYWNSWSPWAKLDPAAKNTIEGPSAGTGAVFTWSGNAEIGEGRMKITESRPDELVKIDLEFIKPFASKCVTEFTFKPAGDETSVTWNMSGKNDFIGKALCLFMDMDKMVGGDFERGLANLNSVVQAKTKEETANVAGEENE
jgi:hypothetical protein